MKPVYELAQVVSLYKAAFIEKHQPLKYQLSVLHAIEQCRTAAMGGHVDACDQCGHLRISYNSCRNRHCPKCQNTNRERWIEAQEEKPAACHLFSCGIYFATGTEYPLPASSQRNI
jgi:hypothetical protein